MGKKKTTTIKNKSLSLSCSLSLSLALSHHQRLCVKGSPEGWNEASTHMAAQGFSINKVKYLPRLRSSLQSKSPDSPHNCASLSNPLDVSLLPFGVKDTEANKGHLVSPPSLARTSHTLHCCQSQKIEWKDGGGGGGGGGGVRPITNTIQQISIRRGSAVKSSREVQLQIHYSCDLDAPLCTEVAYLALRVMKV